MLINIQVSVTFTCNPNCPEIKLKLFHVQASCHRSYLIARVFKRKLKALMDLLTKHCIFGEKLADMYTIEWRKRGLPHSHILLWLNDKLHTSQIDSITSAEFPVQNRIHNCSQLSNRIWLMDSVDL